MLDYLQVKTVKALDELGWVSQIALGHNQDWLQSGVHGSHQISVHKPRLWFGIGGSHNNRKLIGIGDNGLVSGVTLIA